MQEKPRRARSWADRLKDLRTIRIDLRIDLRHSLTMHRQLALAVALPGVALTAIYIFLMWPQTDASAQLTGIITGGALLLLISLSCATAAAVTAHNLDPRVYVGADVERVLGIAPLGELPELTEVSNEIAEADVMRLANGIASRCKKGSLRRCILTGTQSGTGVTTVAMRVRATLESLGRHAVLVDATEAHDGAGEEETGLLGLPGMGGEGASRRDELILTDTSPLPGSPDTEFLARFADCVVVVAESGVTTRAQLVRSATYLQKLNVSTVGFVVNRVGRTQPRAATRSSILNEARGEFGAAVQRVLALAPKHTVMAPKPLVAGEPSGTGQVAGGPIVTGHSAMAPIADRLIGAPGALESAAPSLSSAPTLVPEPQETESRGAAESKAEPVGESAGKLAGEPGTELTAWSEPGIPSWLLNAMAQLEAKDPHTSFKVESANVEQFQVDAMAEAVLADALVSQSEARESNQVTFEAHSKGNSPSTDELETMLLAMGLRNSVFWSDLIGPKGETPTLQGEGAAPNGGAPALNGEPPLLAREERMENKPSRLNHLRNLGFMASLRDLDAGNSNGESLDENPGHPESASRLEGLRGLVNPENLKELDHGALNRGDLNQTDLTGNLKPAREPFAAPGGEYGGPFRNLAMPPSGRVPRMTDPVPPAGPQTFIPFPDLAAMEEELRGEAANGESVNGTGGGGTGGGRAGLSKLQHDRRPTQDPLQILPSRRGQYRKKK